jgi:hypothetical protein
MGRKEGLCPSFLYFPLLLLRKGFTLKGYRG